MIDENNKLSLRLNIGGGNGFMDVQATPTINTRLTLNRQTIAGLNSGNNGGGGPTGRENSPTQARFCVHVGPTLTCQSGACQSFAFCYTEAAGYTYCWAFSGWDCI